MRIFRINTKLKLFCILVLTLQAAFADKNMFGKFKDEVLDTIEKSKNKVENFFNIDQFWDFISFDHGHDKAVVYDYQKFIEEHQSGLGDHSLIRYPT